MRKPTKKLAVRRETLRVLVNAKLVHAAGGELHASYSGVRDCLAVAEPIVQPPGG